ncbi:MAG: serine hydrolase [Bacteroidetes bacterium]|nr:MAG: serine hydrolase [Bacteroidota bacterium]
MKSTLVTLIFTLLAFTQLSAQTQYDDILQEYFNVDGNGAAAIVTKGDKVIYQSAIGKANLELDVDMTPEHIFRIGSITKQFTSTAIMMLHEQGKLNVRYAITDYLTDYPMNDQLISVEHLLTHTSGIQSYTDMPGFMEKEVRMDLTVSELIDVFKNEPMNFDPGSDWRYNNSGYILLGAIIEKVSGETYEDYIETHIFDALGMHSSYYDHNEEIVELRATGYQPAEGGSIVNSDYISMTLPYAAGSLMSTVGDLNKWNQAIMHGELISKESMNRVFTPYVLNDDKVTDYGYGWSISMIGGKPSYEHGGGIFGFLSMGIYVPEEDVYVAVLSNCTCQSPDQAALRMAALASGVSMEFEDIEVSEAALQEYVGVYDIDDSDDKRVFTVTDGKIYSQRAGGQVFQVFPYDKDKFYYESRTTVAFDRDDAGVVVGQTVTGSSGKGIYAIRTDEEIVVAEIVEVSKAVLSNYIGNYQLMEGFDIEISVVGEDLVAQATGQSAITLVPHSDYKFVFTPAGIAIEFPEDNKGEAQEFLLIQGGQRLTAKRK